jgi:hypothetical protein
MPTADPQPWMIPCVTNVPCPSDQTSVQAIRTPTVSMVGLDLSHYSEQQLIAILGRNRNTAAQTNYGDLVWFWAKGLFVSDSADENPAYDPQGTYGMPPWAQSQQFMCICIFDRKFAHIYFPSKVYTFFSCSKFFFFFTTEPAIHAAEPAVHAAGPAVHATEPAVHAADSPWRERTDSAGWIRTSHASPTNYWSGCEGSFSTFCSSQPLYGVRERTQQAGSVPLTPPRRTAGPVPSFSISLAWLATLRLSLRGPRRVPHP